MPYEDDYKMWLEKMLTESSPDWVCDGMYDVELTHEWCGEHCGEGCYYVTPKCLRMFYHHIVRADRKTEQSICDGCKFYDGEDCYSQKFCKVKNEPQTEYDKYLEKIRPTIHIKIGLRTSHRQTVRGSEADDGKRSI